MANKNIDKAKGRAKEAAGAVSGNKRLKNEGRADQAKRLCEKRREQGRRHPHRPQTLGSSSDARANPVGRWEVTMLTILLIIIAVLLPTGGRFGYRRRGRRGF